MGGNTQNINKLREILEHEQLLHHKTRLLYSSIHMLNMTTPQDKTSLLLNSCFKQTRLLYSSIHMLNRDAPSAIDGQVVAARGQLVGGARRVVTAGRGERVGRGKGWCVGSY